RPRNHRRQYVVIHERNRRTGPDFLDRRDEVHEQRRVIEELRIGTAQDDPRGNRSDRFLVRARHRLRETETERPEAERGGEGGERENPERHAPANRAQDQRAPAAASRSRISTSSVSASISPRAA